MNRGQNLKPFVINPRLAAVAVGIPNAIWQPYYFLHLPRLPYLDGGADIASGLVLLFGPILFGMLGALSGWSAARLLNLVMPSQIFASPSVPPRWVIFLLLVGSILPSVLFPISEHHHNQLLHEAYESRSRERLWDLYRARKEDAAIPTFIGANPNAPADLLQAIASESDDFDRYIISRNSNAPPDLRHPKRTGPRQPSAPPPMGRSSADFFANWIKQIIGQKQQENDAPPPNPSLDRPAAR